ncbi:hypothetical protein ACH5RR_023385 [Cinchona calisaya]|uniref:Retrotransposon gag domain-containing protein n=1 Tax=Cinchona calisaya TaxID=153742 RepID=A0ABD2ZFI7_9GENT
MNKLFLAKYFLAFQTANIRKEICGIRQFNDESLYEYWERFKKLCASCPHHQISDSLLIQYFYEVLLPNESNMVDATSRRALDNLTINAARELISNMATRSQKFVTRREQPLKRVNDVNILSLKQQIASLTSLVRQLTSETMHTVQPYGIWSNEGHSIDMCPILQDEAQEQVNAAGGFLGELRTNYDPYSNTYNLGWRDHPNLRYRNPTQPQPQ